MRPAWKTRVCIVLYNTVLSAVLLQEMQFPEKTVISVGDPGLVLNWTWVRTNFPGRTPPIFDLCAILNRLKTFPARDCGPKTFFNSFFCSYWRKEGGMENSSPCVCFLCQHNCNRFHNLYSYQCRTTFYEIWVIIIFWLRGIFFILVLPFPNKLVWALPLALISPIFYLFNC